MEKWITTRKSTKIEQENCESERDFICIWIRQAAEKLVIFW